MDSSAVQPGWGDWLRAHRDTIEQDSPWEWRFAREVLTRVGGLTPGDVLPQQVFIDRKGRRCRVDFAIRCDNTRIAIEIDGANKAGRGPMDSAALSQFLARQNDLVTQGWLVLRFTNAQVRDEPALCAARISFELDKARSIRGSIPDSAPVRSATSTSSRRPHLILASTITVIVVTIVAVLVFSLTRSRGGESPEVAPTQSGECPSSHPVKGNVSTRRGELIYHVPGGDFYAVTAAETCFLDASAAEQTGYRKSES